MSSKNVHFFAFKRLHPPHLWQDDLPAHHATPPNLSLSQKNLAQPGIEPGSFRTRVRRSTTAPWRFTMTIAYFNKIYCCWELLRPHLFFNVAQQLTKYYVNKQAKLKLVNPILLGGNSVFWVPSGLNLIPRYALLHLATLGFRNWLRSVSKSSPQGPKK